MAMGGIDDKLETMFALRRQFMSHLEAVKPGSYPPGPLDISKKSSQQLVRDLALKGVEEMFEALQHLKNWKPHRLTNVNEEIDKDEFLEEIVDAFNYFFSVIIVTGFDEKDLSIDLDNGQLTVVGNKENTNGNFMHQGIATRSFKRTFQLAEYVEVIGAGLINGLLTIALEKKLPEELLPKKI